MKTFAGLLASASLVAGHGYVTNATIGDESYTFYQPYTDPYTSPTPDRVSRPIQGNGPVTDVTISDIQCGGYAAGGINGSSPAALEATVAAGSTVDLYWTLWPESHVGPTLTYMARCANDDCTTYMPDSDAVWFKIQEEGRDGTSDTWGDTAVMTAGGFISYTIPECIESGSYLVRHEIIALHSAYSEGGAQFYPGCHQITVTGGTGASTPADLVAFPGAYKADDAGILYDAYKATEYTLPGPALFTCDGSSSSGSSSSYSGSSSSSGSSAAAPVASSAAAPSSTLATVTRAASSAYVAAVATPTAAAVSGEDDDGCDAEVTVTSTISPSAAPVATDSASSSSSSSSSDEGEDDDGCDAEDDDSSSTVTTGAATTGDESSSTGSESSSSSASDEGDEGDDDECEADEPTAAASTASAQPTGAASSDDEDCDAEEEQYYARRFVASGLN